MSYTSIAIIYNPNSTGPSKSLAVELKSKLRKQLPDCKVELIATKHAGHAEELAYSIATSSKRPLIISSSGDGGYNEVINGAMKAKREGASPTVGLLPAGNANDHYRNLHDKELIDRIVQDDPIEIDILKIVGVSDGKRIERYAHSYIGFGLTPVVGNELNKTKLNFFSEVWIVIRLLFTIKSVRLKVGNKARYYESLICSNVDEMSKYMKISQPSSVTDGKFEVTIFKRRSKLRLILTLLKASFIGVKESAQISEYSLKTLGKTLAQADGEIIHLDANSDVQIKIDQQILPSLV